MPETPEEFPNWQLHDDSPQLNAAGVAIKMPTVRLGDGEPVVVRGAYEISAKLMHEMADEPPTWLLVITVRRDHPA